MNRLQPRSQSGTVFAIVAGVVLITMICWWLPQKWAACQLLYSNPVAQLLCFGG